MPGKCGSTYRIGARVAPLPCNALTELPSGLLVPSTEVAGLAPGGAVGTSRSVDIDVTAPAADACPAVWTVGARLTPVGGEVQPSAALNLMALAAGVWADIPGMSFVAPETGMYLVTADVTGVVTASGQTSFNRLLQTRWTYNAGPVGPTIRQLIQMNWSLSGGTNQASGYNASNSTTRRMPLTAGDVIAVQASYQGVPGVAVSMTAGAPLGSLLTWTKVGD
ncbi:hypothetical protein [Streptomyces sp. NPDC047070]|uniref:hypothetical protein n=1 Tax=Streptomyces sp. NPDC047070 TaxID=3154923 RepID=UPI0034557550